MLLYIALITGVITAVAIDRDLTWQMTEPTQRTDGSVLNPATDISGYRLNCYHPIDKDDEIDKVVPRAQMSVMGPQVWYVWKEAVPKGIPYICRAKAVDKQNLESAWSDTVEIPFDVESPVLEILN
jgi:hypothetical protein